jgi:hypothetical protein
MTEDSLALLAQERDVDFDMITRALTLVRQFITDRDLIIYGGLAIDYSLRRASADGARIYPDEELPDYDFFSPRAVDDARELADLLTAAGFTQVSVVRRFHVQTMGVRVDFRDVADISYAPPYVFERLPTVTYRGLRVIHPDYQRIDMHLAFSYPFLGAPMEAVFHRYSKDLARYNLLDQYYPLGDDTRATQATVRVRVSLPADARASTALHGFAAYAMLQLAVDDLVGAVKNAGGGAVKSLAAARDTSVEFTVERDDSRLLCSLKVPKGAPRYVAVASSDPLAVLEGADSPQWYAPYMDQQPPMAISDSLRVYSTKNKLLAVAAVRDDLPLMVSPQYLMMYLLFEAEQAKDDPAQRALYLDYYRRVRTIINLGSEVLRKLAESATNPAKMINSSPFGLTTRTMGDVNHEVSFLISVANAAKKAKIEPPVAVPPLEGLPENYYPRPSDTPPKRPPFDYDANPLFRRAGQRADEFPQWY